MRKSILIVFLFAVFAVMALPKVFAEGYRFPDAASDALGPFIIAGQMSLLSDKHLGSEKFLEGAKAIAVTSIVTQAVKRLTREKRPNSTELSSFPSGHASIAFAMAAVIDKYQPERGTAAYAVAAVIAWSRIEVRAHYWQDVVAGALIGHYVARQVIRDFPNSAQEPLGFIVRW